MGPQEHKVERRLAAIFAADVVGSSRLMEEDEEGTLSAIQQSCRRSSGQPPRGIMGAS